MSLTPSAYANFLARLHIFSGAGGGGRTHTVSLPRDFEAQKIRKKPAFCQKNRRLKDFISKNRRFRGYSALGLNWV